MKQFSLRYAIALFCILAQVTVIHLQASSQSCSSPRNYVVGSGVTNGSIGSSNTGTVTTYFSNGCLIPDGTCNCNKYELWYKFTTTNAGIYTITVVGGKSANGSTVNSGMDPVVELRTDACQGSLIQGVNSTGRIGTEVMTPTLSASTTYRVRVYARHCNDSAPWEFTFQVDPPLCTAGSTPSVVSSSTGTDYCAGQSTTLTQVGGTLGAGGYWQWYTGSCGGTPIDTGATITVSPTTSTTYFVGASNGSCYTPCASATLTLSSVFTPVIYGPLNLCGGQFTTLSVVNTPCTGTCFYRWSNGASGLSATVSPSVTTTYTVTVSNACGDSTFSTFTVPVVPAPPSVNVSGNVLTCSVASQPGYQWYVYSGGNFTSIPGATAVQYTVPQDGCYRVRITDSNGCMAYSDSVCVIFTGIDGMHPSGNLQFSAYPNPAKDKVYVISHSVIHTIELTDVTGKLLLSKEVNAARFDIDVSGFGKGVYLITAKGDGKQAHGKVVIE